MIKINQKILFRILNVWFAYLMILLFSSYLPHWESIDYYNWINQAIYFLLFILSFSVFTKETFNKDLFLNLSIYLFVMSFSFLNIFLGDDYLLGNDNVSYYFYHYKTLLFCFFFNLFIIYTVLKYLFPNIRKFNLYLVCLTFLIPIFIVQFSPYIKDLKLVNTLTSGQYLSDLNRRVLLTYGFSLPFFIIYGYRLYKKDRIIGEYINMVMACFFIYICMDLIDMLSAVFHFRLYNISQYILTINSILICVILFKKLSFLTSEYGQFYESLVHNKINLGKIQIKRQRSEVNSRLIKFIKLYFYQRRNYLFSLVFICIIGCSYFELPKGLIVNMIGYVGSLFVLFLFIHALYKRRAKQKFILD
ncbi:hypothetical protein JW824_08815 [bacterium]|nr:hypothetical protein [bacterium]